MKLNLIRNNLSACEEELEKGQVTKAAESLYQIARLLLIQADTLQKEKSAEPAEIRKRYISLIGVAGAVQMQLETLASKTEKDLLVPQMKHRIAEIQEAFCGMETQKEELEKLHGELLAAEEQLRKEKAQKEALLQKIQELTKMKEEELRDLKQKIESQQNLLDALEAEYTSCEKNYLLVEAELKENNYIISSFPDASGIQSIDDLIRYAKERKETIERAGISGRQQIRQVIEEVQRIQALTE